MKLRYLLVVFACLFIFSSAWSQAPEKGKVSGRVIDKELAEPMVGVTILVEGSTLGTATDLDGKYTLSLNPGTYTLIFRYVGYQNKKLPVKIVAKQTTLLNAVIQEEAAMAQEVEIVAKVSKASNDVLLIEQKNATSVSSGISADLIRRTPDRTTADVIKRVSGASIQDNKFAIIRGLGDRYNMGMLNGAILPSSESDRKAFALDMLPAGVVENLVIYKTFTPDLPADFGGGLIMINTTDIPFEDRVNISAGVGTHSLTTGFGFYQGPTSSTDWLGFDNSTRVLPNGVLPTQQGKDLSPNLPDQAATLTRQSNLFNNNFRPSFISSARPNLSFNASASKRLKVLGNDFGVIGALTYSNTLRNAPSSAASPVIFAEASVPRVVDGDSIHFDNYRKNVNLGAILNFTYKVGANNKFTFRNFLSLTSEEIYSQRTLRNLKDQQLEEIRNEGYIFFYQSNRMYAGQFSGEHFLPNKVRVQYVGGLTDIYRNTPDFRRLYYQERRFDPADPFQPNQVITSPVANTFAPQQSGRWFSELFERSYNFNLNVTVPVKALAGDLKFGTMTNFRTRDFTARNFLFTYTGNYAPYLGQGPDSVLRPENIGRGKILHQESTQSSDAYQASSYLQAAYVMLDHKIFPSLRAVYGYRVERFNQRLNSISESGAPVRPDSTITDWLPAAALTWSLNEASNLRFSFAKTLSRPEFREFAPLAFYEYNYNSIIVGNPNLVRTQIYNIDVKYEWFPSEGQTFSVNPFVKYFDKPVETAIAPSQGLRSFSYFNAKEALNFGVELEARVNLTLLDTWLGMDEVFRNLALYGNYSFIRSRVDLTGSEAAFRNRPLQGQSPYVLNAGLAYTSTDGETGFSINVNRIGRRIAIVANETQLVIYENPRTVVDFSVNRTFFKRLQTKVVLGDILAQRLVWYQDLNKNGRYDKRIDVETFSFLNGMTVSLTAGYTF